MYDVTYDELDDAGIFIRLLEPLFIDIDGNPCEADECWGLYSYGMLMDRPYLG
jgi:hypothetical protein